MPKDSQFPKVAVYDNGGKTCDRFTAVFINEPERQPGVFAALAMNSEPFHPQGFGQHTTAMRGKHLGKRIDSSELSLDCQSFIQQNI